jgi:glutamyl-Q tRNA(Asp) synthetase
MPQPVFRLAPSPNGRLHLGHAYSALLNEQMARESNGRLLLRIEDTDVTRATATFTQHLIDDLRWLGLTWEEPVRIQSQHFADYDMALHRLWDEDLIYPCFCSRKIAARDGLPGKDPDGQPYYAGTCRLLPRRDAEGRMQSGKAHGWRLKTKGTPAHVWGDVTIAKPRTGSWYHIAVVVDDALQGVTHVVRGQDVEQATSIHTLLQQHLGLPTPHYHHHRLICDDAGQKLSKRIGSRSLGSLQEEGATADGLRQKLGFA